MKYAKAWEKSNLNCKMQAHATACIENKLELELKEEKQCQLISFRGKCVSLKKHIGRVKRCI